MAIVLKVTPEVLTRMSGDIEQQIKNIENQFKTIENDIQQTKSWWEGDASDSHIAQYNALKDGINEAVKRLKDHPTNLLKMAGLYVENESRQEAAAQSLQADVIV